MGQRSHREREAYWQQKVKEYIGSGLTQREFCRRQDVSYWSFNSWHRRLTATPKETGLVEVTSRALATQTASTEAFEIIISSGLRIRIPEKFNHETLTRIVDTLDGRR